MSISFKVCKFAYVFLSNEWHDAINFSLNLWVHFPVINADSVFFIHRNFCKLRTISREVKSFPKQSIDLFDAAFMASLLFHYFEEYRKIQGDNGDNCTGTGYQALID